MSTNVKCLLVVCIYFMVIMLFGVSSAKDFYVSDDGSDENHGNSKDKSWKTKDKANSMKYNKGDTIKFKRSPTWKGRSVNYALKKMQTTSSIPPSQLKHHDLGAFPIIDTRQILDISGKWKEEIPDVWCNDTEVTEMRWAWADDVYMSVETGTMIENLTENEYLFDDRNDIFCVYEEGNPAFVHSNPGIQVSESNGFIWQSGTEYYDVDGIHRIGDDISSDNLTADTKNVFLYFRED